MHHKCATSTVNVKRALRGGEDQEVRVRIMRSYAHPQGVFIYCIEMDDRKLVVATDTEGVRV